MKKTGFWLALAAVCVLIVGYFLWPLSFDSYFEDPTQVFAVHTVFSVDYDRPEIDTTRYGIEPGGEEYTRLEELLGQYTSHRCLATLRNEQYMEGIGEDMTIWFAYAGDGANRLRKLTFFQKRAEIWAEREDGKIATYRVGYLGNGKAAELYQRLREMVVTWEPEE